MGIGSPGGQRFNFTLSEELMATKVMTLEFNVADDEFPLGSSIDGCPIIDLKFMEDDGYGNPTVEANPEDVRIEIQESSG